LAVQRQASVENGLQDLPDTVGIVVVHDAARPLVADATIDGVIAAARAGYGAVAALPVVDTLKEVDEHGRVVRTVERTRLWRAQTPQAFPRASWRALTMREAGPDRGHRRRGALRATWDRGDRCSGERAGMKITDESDFARADALAGLVE